MKYIKDLFDDNVPQKPVVRTVEVSEEAPEEVDMDKEDDEEDVEDKVEDATSKASFWIIYKADDKDRKKVDSFEGDDDEIEEFLKKKNAESDVKYKAWTIEGLNVNDEEETDESIVESCSIKRDCMFKDFYTAKKEGALASSGIVPHPFTNDKKSNVITYEPGDVIMVSSQSGSMGLLFSFFKVKINGDTVDYYSSEVTMWTGYKNPTTEKPFTDNFDKLEVVKK